MQQSKPFCIIVLNWNNAADTIECLNSILPSVQCNNAAVIVCDNASTDDSIEKITAWAKTSFAYHKLIDNHGDKTEITSGDWEFILLRNHSNLGYAGGNNAGIRLALQSAHNFAYLLLLNNDTVLHADALDRLDLCAKQNPHYGIIGATLLNFDKPDQVQCAGGCRYNAITTIQSNCYVGLSLSEVLSKDEKLKLNYVNGAASLYRAEVIREFGLLDERYFLYYEELDYTKRLATSHFTPGWCKQSFIFHKGGTDTQRAKNKSKQRLLFENYHENLSTLRYSKKHYPILFPVPAILRFFGKSLKYLVSGKLYLFPALFSAYKDFFFKRRDKTSSDQTGMKPILLARDAFTTH